MTRAAPLPATTAREAPAATAEPLGDTQNTPAASPAQPPEPAEPPPLLPLETSCDAKDEDGDGHTDLLLPTGANACVTTARGACAEGWAWCWQGKAACDTPPPMPEVAHGIDNDCNGVVDDVPPARVQPRALVLGPSYIWRDAISDVAAVTTALDQGGVAYDVQAVDSNWSTLVPTFARYSLLVIPGYLEGVSLDATMQAALEMFATGGGVIIVMKPIAGPHQNGSLELTGIKSARRAGRATELRIVATDAPALAGFDSFEERVVPLTANAAKRPVDVWTYDLNEGTHVLADAYAGSARLGAAATRRPLGRGAIYAWGHNLTTFDTGRCYVNCFEPSGDLLRLFLRDALREGSQGHVVLKHPMPGLFRSTLLLTHDVSSRDAYNEGPWGEPGTLQMAAMERQNDARASYNFTTARPADGFNPAVVAKVHADGFGPPGAHSVRHSPAFGRHPRGTCQETAETYLNETPSSVCGEVRVSLEILGKLVEQRPRSWRSPYLAGNAHLFEVLADSGVTLDSSLAVGDLKYNLPVDTSRTPKLQHLFHQRALLEFPITGEDGTNVSARQRRELDADSKAWFAHAWEYTMLRNAENGSLTTLLVHPTRGDGASDDNIKVKVGVVEHVIRMAKAHGIATESLVRFGDFWRARSKVSFDATYDTAAGYAGTIVTGDEPVENLTLDFGDVLRSFDCKACGQVEVSGKLAVVRTKLAPRTRATFTAAARETR